MTMARPLGIREAMDEAASRFICVVQHGDVVFIGHVQIGIIKVSPAWMQMMIDAPVAPAIDPKHPGKGAGGPASPAHDEDPLDVCPPQRPGFFRYIAIVRDGDGVRIGPIHANIVRHGNNRMNLYIAAPERPIIMVREGHVRVGKHHPLPAPLPLRATAAMASGA